jgi:hypothetical protein
MFFFFFLGSQKKEISLVITSNFVYQTLFTEPNLIFIQLVYGFLCSYFYQIDY